MEADSKIYNRKIRSKKMVELILFVLVVGIGYAVYKVAKPTVSQKVEEVKDKVEDKVDEVKVAADVNKDGKVNVSDAIAAAKEVVKKGRKPKK